MNHLNKACERWNNYLITVQDIPSHSSSLPMNNYYVNRYMSVDGKKCCAAHCCKEDAERIISWDNYNKHSMLVMFAASSQEAEDQAMKVDWRRMYYRYYWPAGGIRKMVYLSKPEHLQSAYFDEVFVETKEEAMQRLWIQKNMVPVVRYIAEADLKYEGAVTVYTEGELNGNPNLNKHEYIRFEGQVERLARV